MATNLLQALGFQVPGGFNPDDPYGSTVQPPQAAPPPPIVNAPPPANMLQALDGAPPAPAAPMQAGPVADAGTRPARARSSFLDKIGRVADVLATVGGAPALYQPTLDSRQDREIALGDHDRQVDLDKLKQTLSQQQITAGEGKLGDEGNARLGQAARGLQAILSANPNADVAQVWPMLAQQAGVPADRAKAVGDAIAANPSLVAGLSDAINGTTDKFTGNVVYATGPDGKLAAFQPGSNVAARNILPQGYTPIDPAKPVNTGGSTQLIGTRTGEVQKILPNTEAPGKKEDRQQRGTIAANRDSTAIRVANIGAGSRITVASLPARTAAGGGKQAKGGDEAHEALIGLDNIQRGFDELHNMKALPGDPGSATGNILSALGRTGLGQKVGEQFGDPAAQKRLELGKNISTLQQTLIKALPASATRTKFEQEILKASLPDPSKMSYSTARTVIQQYKDIFRRAQAAAARSATPAAPARTPVKPATAGGWSVVGVK